MQPYVMFVRTGEDTLVTHPDGTEHKLHRVENYLIADVLYFGSTYRYKRFSLNDHNKTNTEVYHEAVAWIRSADRELENLMRHNRGKMPDCVSPTTGLAANRLIDKF